MKVLGIESSCDETAAAIVEDGYRLLGNVVSSQMLDFAAYGGVIPEIAARSHIEVISSVIEKALAEADCSWSDIDAIAVTYAPGLIGSLLVGTLAARTIAHAKQIPLYPVHHVEGHVYANFITEAGYASTASEAPLSSTPLRPRSSEAQSKQQLAPSGVERKDGGSELQRLTLPSKQPAFPMLALIVSGGHSQLVLFHDHGVYELLGQAQDDAVGEAFDKVAKVIGLPYPGGVSISKLAPEGDAHAFEFPKARLSCPSHCTHQPNRPVTQADIDTGNVIKGGRGEYFLKERCHKYDFSFSGLKTAVLRAVQEQVGVDHTFPSHDLPERVSDVLRANVAASFQRTVVETLVEKTLSAFHDYSPASVVIAGGVAANQELRRQLQDALPIRIEYAPMSLCTDNAAMIASLGYYHAQKVAPTDPLDLEVLPSISMTKTAWGQ